MVSIWNAVNQSNDQFEINHPVYFSFQIDTFQIVAFQITAFQIDAFQIELLFEIIEEKKTKVLNLLKTSQFAHRQITCVDQ